MLGITNKRRVKGKFQVSVFILFTVISVCNTALTFQPLKCPDKPEIRLALPNGNANVLHDEEKKELTVSERLNLTLECLSTKPIDFDFEGQFVLQLYQVEMTRRKIQSSRNNGGETGTFDSDCFSIQIQFSSDREATGQYKCWNIDEQAKAIDKLYIYANGGTLPHLLHGDFGEEMTIHAINKDLAILPCQTTNPNIPVALYRSTPDGFILQTEGQHLSFDPKIGFSLNLNKFPDPFGNYKCVAKNKKHADEVAFELHEFESNEKLNDQGGQPIIFQNQFARGKEHHYQALVCTGNVGLEMKSTSNCRSVIECRLLERCAIGMTTCTNSCKCSSHGQTCSRSLLKQLFNSPDKHLNEKCETVGKNENGGVIHCTSSKYLEGTTFPYFIGLDGHMVNNWRNAPTREILATAAPLGIESIYNVGEKIPFICVASRYVFSRGFQWKILLKNGTLISANTTIQSTRKTNSLIQESVLIHISHPDIHKIVCEAPVWNETTWISSSLTLRVRDTVAPTFFDPANVTVYFHSNEKNKTIICEAQGFPHPDLIWYKNGEEIRSDLIFDSTKDNITLATLTFPEILDSEHGTVYMCNASNPRGMVFKTFTVHLKVSIWTVIFSILGAALFICFVIVVIMSVQLFRGGRKPSGYTFHFSDFDVEEFKNGNPDQVKNCKDIGEKAFYLPYDEERYEIKEDHLIIGNDRDPGDQAEVLGQGEFGIVKKGRLTSNDGESYPVAIKTSKTTDAQQLKALLSELKIMIYIGQHKYIVKLIGAVTTQLSDRRAYVVVEYCPLGNLEIYIRTRRTSFLNEFDSVNSAMGNIAVTPSYVRFNYAIKTTDLIKWSYEIATGMEYLASKKIIHGDLSLRNILLDANQDIKITDFGLSKQLYKCSSYYLAKSKDTLLPWKWLSPEALRFHTFSVQSDIWSFGVLLWEMFSLGDTPYSGVMYGEGFLELLANGSRLNKPHYCNTEIYGIMRECWREDPEQRPNFTNLRQEFAEKLPTNLIDTEDVVIQNANNHLQEILLPQYIEECQPLRA